MSIANSSRRVYAQGQSSFSSFCSGLQIRPYPLSQHNLCLFTTYLARTLSYSTIRTYLAAVRFRNIELGFYSNFEPMQNLQMLLRGIKRVKGISLRPSRLPITLNIMKILKLNLRKTPLCVQDKLMLWAAFTTAFFGLLRSSEFCCESKSSYNPNSTLLLRDVILSENVAKIQIKVSKADPFRNGHEVRLAASQSSVCAFRALNKYMTFCSCPTAPLFAFSDSTYLTRQRVTKSLQSLVGPSFPDVDRYSSHSFRIGGATSAAAADLPDWLIKTLGRWSSNCYERYIRNPTNIIDNVPYILAHR